jgi:serine protease Do
MGIGFAVPSNMVRVMLSAFEQGKKNITHPWLGISSQEITPELAASMNMAQPSGLLVNEINPASPAVKAGLHIGDVITSVNGRTIEDSDSLHYRIATLPVGSNANLGILRKGQKLEISVTLVAPPENPPRESTSVTGRNPLAGAVIENLSPAVIEESGLHSIERGVVVRSVKEGIAANVGIQPGDVILSINGTKVVSVGEVMSAVDRPASSWRLSVQRGDNTMTIMVGG